MTTPAPGLAAPTAPAEALSARLALWFSCIGHAYSHLVTLLYLTVVLSLERDWGLGYAELLQLSALGAFLFGAGALPMGWIGDRWSAVGMMVVYFLATGLATALTGFARTPTEMMLGLAAIGLASSIYHPVGIAWLVRNALARGKALGVNGLFGSIGVAAASGVAGVLSDLVSWRAAFFVPGAVCFATGVALLVCWRAGWVVDRQRDRVTEKPATRQEMWRVFVVLSVTMLCAGVIYQGTLTVMPKLFAERMQGWISGTSAVGAIVMALYLASGLVQVAGGQLADRFPPKLVYAGMFAVQIPLLVLAGAAGGPAIVVLMFAINALTVMAAPAESALLTRYSPSRHRGLAFGAKFVLSLGIAPVAIMLVAWVEQATGGFFALFALLAGFGATLVAAALLLPGETALPAARVAAPAE
jgi:MFS family permease